MSEMANVERHAKDLGDRSASWFARFGINRLAAGILLLVLGLLVLVFPALIVWIVGVGAIALGIVVLAYSPSGTT